MNSALLRAVAGLVPVLGCAAGLDVLTSQVKEFSLANGMRLAVVERRASPSVAIQLRIRAGSVDEAADQVGVAALVGSSILHAGEALGTINLNSERDALAQADEWRGKYAVERAQGEKANRLFMEDYDRRTNQASTAAGAFGRPFFLRSAIAYHGGGVESTVSRDAHSTSVIVPPHAVEVWFKLTADWLKKPSWRGWAASQASAARSLEEQGQSFLNRIRQLAAGAALADSRYGRPQADPALLATLRTRTAEEFHQANHTADRISLAIVGDVDAESIRRLSEQYFATLPRGKTADPPPPADLARKGQRLNSVGGMGGRALGVAWVRPTGMHADAPAMDLLAGYLLGGGKESPVEMPLWRDGHALAVETDSSFPGERFPSLLAIWMVVAPSSEGDGAEKAIQAVVGRVREQPIPGTELDRVRRAFVLGMAARAQTRSGLAAMLAGAGLQYGGWAGLQARLTQVEAVTPEQVRAAAAKYLAPESAYVVTIGQSKEAQ